MLKLFLIIFIHIYVVDLCYGYNHNFGSCPKIRAVDDFEISKFLGKWFGMEANDQTLSCLEFNFRYNNHTKKYSIEESSNLQYLKYLQSYFTRSGKMKPNLDIPASMSITWHWSSPYEEMVVFDTDYRNYAGVFFCSKVLLTSQTRIFILSRSLEISDDYKEKVKAALKLNRYNSKDMWKIKHEDCTTEESKNTFKINITENAFSPKEIGQKIKKIWKDNFEKKDCSKEDNSTSSER